ncbi:sterile alpha motif domain-containing protein 9-like [Synchiropus splendidus]|uniref:sterile alpha motif domain-containing protein 9-like n=1 Tax=Synchiropus splendidus TaxID=270530 RepID=UPI00237E1081|nr:sterile alpha motif domain-containing protein 9-like [Synchiropus splendidus]XP_053706829.1 sterile alpha motif domain-containing protein 9-like [Synchiropus splendidus]XP_053706830.1 sterile alpha motif domain-containing protein 9-like [Synchiropus splendidus]XP_053706831.1 sterile alpha motif domain-containing protein 9-like [Synchiropus splendidus]XP_053706832.1 sterile alpha motif domain-containing protein 9-like [Synchiropus splendidus]
MAEQEQTPLENWTEDQVRDWLRSIGLKEKNVEKMYNEEVDGKVLLHLDADFLSTKICLAHGPAFLIITKRNELIDRQRVKLEGNSASDKQVDVKKKTKKTKSPKAPPTTRQAEVGQDPIQGPMILESTVGKSNFKEECKPRPFDQDALDFIYVKNRVLLPESGAFDLIVPCHEYKSFAVAATLDRTRLQAKFAYEVLKFATGCMNIRTNGTIHFGVMDSREDSGYVHGEIIGVPISDKDVYVDALNYIERSFSSDKDHIRQCVRPPRFIEVMDRESPEKRYIVEVDIVPLSSIVKSKVYSVSLPKFNESSNKVQMEKDVIYRRVGSKTEPVTDTDIKVFYERVNDRDAQRDEAEKNNFYCAPALCKDLGRKLTMLMTGGKKFIDKAKWFILVTNKLSPADLSNIDWLLNLNIFCVFDFDPDSKVSGLCSRFLQHHIANMHSLESYRKPTDMTVKELEIRLNLFDQTSWIFPNGRSDFDGDQISCDGITWFRTKMTLLQEPVSLICKQIFPKGAFQVIFLLTSAVEIPLLHTFQAFYADMKGHEDIICICESEETFSKWQAFAEVFCTKDAVDTNSVVGLKMSHVDAILQQVQPVRAGVAKLLPVVNGTCTLEAQQEERMCSLEVLLVNHCDDTSTDFIHEEKENIEQQFYRGGRVTWMNFWLADHKHVGEVIERDAYEVVSKLLNENLRWNDDQDPVVCININHHPGSGGSTVARQLLWKQRKTLRCAVIKPDQSATDVAQHADELRQYEEKDPRRCLPVLLLIEDSDKEYLDDLRHELVDAMHVKKIKSGTPCFILLSCRRSHDPERRSKEFPLKNVSVTHRLSAEEKRKFAAKRDILEQQYQPDFILTFVLMSEAFSQEYIRQFVKHLLQDIDHTSPVTRLMHYVALLNTYVQNSYISQSHCEAFLGLRLHMERFRQYKFEKLLSDQAKLVFLHLRDDKTHIESIRIIHPLVAKEILEQLLCDQMTQSKLAMRLLEETVLFEHRFGKHEYHSFLRALFTQRLRTSKGDERDSLFSPLIEDVRKYEGGPDPATILLRKAFERFHSDPFIAQHLARLHYHYEQFEDAKHWAEVTAQQQPNNSFILDTKGQVYKKWFQAKCKAMDNNNVPKTVDSIADAVGTALKAIECFQDCQRADKEDKDHVNNSGYFAEVEVGCSLLKLIQSLPVFSNTLNGHAECMKYLLTDYIPQEISESWKPFHDRLKKLHKTMQDSLEWISEDLSYFQTEIDAEEEETPESAEEKISHPLSWLTKRSSEFGKYFSESFKIKPGQPIPTNLTPFQKQMFIYQLGGGNITSILSKLSDHRDAVRLLETILSLYPSDPLRAKLGQKHIVCYVLAQITLNCLSSQTKPPSMRDLQALCKQFPADERKPETLFLLTLLFWPDDHDSDTEKEAKYEIIQSAVADLNNHYWNKMKDIPRRKRRIYTHFYLGRGKGLYKFVHKMKFEKLVKVSSVSERRLKWLSGEVWKRPEVAVMLKRVSGWTEDGVVYLAGPKTRKFSLLPLHVRSVPHSNENITFYLGFTFRGLVACDIKTK